MLSFYCGYAGGSGKVRGCVRGENAFTHICVAEGLGRKLRESHSTRKDGEKPCCLPIFHGCLRDGKHTSRLCVLIIYRLPFFIFLLKYEFLRESRKIFVRKQLFSFCRLTFLQAMQQMNQYECFLQNTGIFYLFRNRSHNITC